MPLTIWKEADRRCTVTVNGMAITVQLIEGERLLHERVVESADQALNLAEVWAEAWKTIRSRPSRPATRRQRHAAPRPAAVQQETTAATPRVMWIDRR